MPETLVAQIETGMNDERIAERQTLARRIRETEELLAHLRKRHADMGGTIIDFSDELLTPAEIRQLLLTDENRQPFPEDDGRQVLLDVDPDEDPERWDGLS